MVIQVLNSKLGITLRVSVTSATITEFQCHGKFKDRRCGWKRKICSSSQYLISDGGRYRRASPPAECRRTSGCGIPVSTEDEASTWSHSYGNLYVCL